CENPYYVGPTDHFEYEFDAPHGETEHWFRIPFFNPCDVVCFPHWHVSARAYYVFPDYSWGSLEHGRGVQDEGRTVRVPAVGSLLAGENLIFETPPDEGEVKADKSV